MESLGYFTPCGIVSIEEILRVTIFVIVSYMSPGVNQGRSLLSEAKV